MSPVHLPVHQINEFGINLLPFGEQFKFKNLMQPQTRL